MIWTTAILLGHLRWRGITIFGGNPNRKHSEEYGFVIPLRPDLHPNGVHAGQGQN